MLEMKLKNGTLRPTKSPSFHFIKTASNLKIKIDYLKYYLS